MKQTSVEWFVEQIAYKNQQGYWCNGVTEDSMIHSLVNQALELEEQQIVNAHQSAQIEMFGLVLGEHNATDDIKNDFEDSINYYKKTYGKD